MENAVAVAAVLGPAFLVCGLSKLLYSQSWQRLFEKWSSDHYSLFTLAVFQTLFGLVVVRLYNEWAWNLWLLVTLTGWMNFLMGVFYFLAPGPGVVKMVELGKNKALFYLYAVLEVVVGLVLGYNVYFV